MTQQQITFIAWRFYLVLSAILIITSGLVWRAFDLAVLRQYFLQHRGNERVLRQIDAPVFRGMIVDRHGAPLAVSASVFSAWINFQEFSPTVEQLAALAKMLGIPVKKIFSIATAAQRKKRVFAYLRRGIAPDLAAQIRLLQISGLYLQQTSHRYYPEGETTAHLIGFTNIDDHGQEGLELAYNAWLQGKPGKKWVIKDRLGRVIADVHTIQAQQNGHDLVLSIDRRIQYLAYRALLAGVLENHAHSGSAVVLDAKTGEVLAMVNQPSFNPNTHPLQINDSFRNRAVTDVFEPGSTIKAFSIASALEGGHYQPSSVIDTYPGWLKIGHNIVKDEKNNGLLTVRQIMQLSSNVGVAKMILSLPRNQLWSVLHRVGFGEITGINLPGEQNGLLMQHEPWVNSC